MNLKPEKYKGYTIKFVEKILGGEKLVIGNFSSKVTGKMLGQNGETKQVVYDKCKKMIDREMKVKGLK